MRGGATGGWQGAWHRSGGYYWRPWRSSWQLWWRSTQEVLLGQRWLVLLLQLTTILSGQWQEGWKQPTAHHHHLRASQVLLLPWTPKLKPSPRPKGPPSPPNDKGSHQNLILNCLPRA